MRCETSVKRPTTSSDNRFFSSSLLISRHRFSRSTSDDICLRVSWHGRFIDLRYIFHFFFFFFFFSLCSSSLYGSLYRFKLSTRSFVRRRLVRLVSHRQHSFLSQYHDDLKSCTTITSILTRYRLKKNANAHVHMFYPWLMTIFRFFLSDRRFMRFLYMYLFAEKLSNWQSCSATHRNRKPKSGMNSILPVFFLLFFFD